MANITDISQRQNEASAQDHHHIKRRGCLIVFILVFILFAAFCIQAVYEFRMLGKTKWTSFDEEKTAYIEEHMLIDIPEDVTIKLFKRTTGAGDGTTGRYRLWLEDIDDPEDFMEEAYNNASAYSLFESYMGQNYEHAISELEYEDFDKKDDIGDPYAVYNCVFPQEEGKMRRDYYVAFFTEREGGYRAKVVGYLS